MSIPANLLYTLIVPYLCIYMYMFLLYILEILVFSCCIPFGSYLPFIQRCTSNIYSITPTHFYHICGNFDICRIRLQLTFIHTIILTQRLHLLHNLPTPLFTYISMAGRLCKMHTVLPAYPLKAP